MESLQLELTIEEVNTILTALGQRPFMEVHQLIQKIQSQASPQLQKLQETRDGEKKANDTVLEQ